LCAGPPQHPTGLACCCRWVRAWMVCRRRYGGSKVRQGVWASVGRVDPPFASSQGSPRQPLAWEFTGKPSVSLGLPALSPSREHRCQHGSGWSTGTPDIMSELQVKTVAHEPHNASIQLIAHAHVPHLSVFVCLRHYTLKRLLMGGCALPRFGPDTALCFR
jgi:hypothetical protein